MSKKQPLFKMWKSITTWSSRTFLSLPVPHHVQSIYTRAHTHVHTHTHARMGKHTGSVLLPSPETGPCVISKKGKSRREKSKLLFIKLFMENRETLLIRENFLKTMEICSSWKFENVLILLKANCEMRPCRQARPILKAARASQIWVNIYI